MTKTAESAVVALETLELGSPWRELLDASTSAIEAENVAPDAEVFPPEVVPVTEATQRQYVDHTGRWPAIGYDGRALDLHGRCVGSHPELARCLRSPELLEDIALAAARQAAPASNTETHAAAGARAAAVAVTRYKLGCAAQIAAVNGHELQAAALTLLACEALRVRADAARQRHEAHATAELDRVEADIRAATTAAGAERSRRVAEAAEAARAAAVAAQQAANDARLVRAGALQERLRERLARAARARDHHTRIRLEHVSTEKTLHDVASLIRESVAFSEEQLRYFEAALDGDA